MSGKERRLPDWIQDVRDAIANIKGDIGDLSEESLLDSISAVNDGAGNVDEGGPSGATS